MAQTDDSYEEFTESRQEVPGEGWAVVIHDDDLHEMRHVLKALRRSADISHEAALEVTWQASMKGWAIVTITSKDRANAIVRQLRTEQMSVELLPC